MRIVITLDFEGDDAEEHAEGIVDDVLDAGVLQDAINEMASDRGYDLTVSSADCTEEVEPAPIDEDPSRVSVRKAKR